MLHNSCLNFYDLKLILGEKNLYPFHEFGVDKKVSSLLNPLLSTTERSKRYQRLIEAILHVFEYRGGPVLTFLFNDLFD